MILLQSDRDEKETVLHNTFPLLNGLVLSGGKSKRMGIDKGSIHYHNKSQREHVYELLLPLCHEVFVSVNEQQIQSTLQLPYIQDVFIDKGPAGGILSAFEHNPNVAWLVVACDLPFVNRETISYLVHHRNPSKTATAFWNEEGELPEPLIAIWEPKAFPLLLQFVNDGFSCPRKFLIRSDVEMLSAPDASVFKNINTKREYEEVIQAMNKDNEVFHSDSL